MPSANVNLPIPLTRVNPMFPGQFGVPGTSNKTGLRTHCTGAVFYVDPNAAGADDARDGTDPNCAFETLQAAVDACTSWRGDVIYVMANNDSQYGPGGTDYVLCIDEDVTVTKHGIRIVGVAQSSTLGVMWRPATAGGIACLITGFDVLVEGFCFYGSLLGGGGTGISCVWDGVTDWGENTVIRNCFFGDDIDIGIQLEYSWNCYIYDNEFQMCDDAGIYCDPADSPMEYCTIKDNIFMDVGLGGTGAMAISEAEGCTIKNNTVFNTNAQAGAACTNEGINTGAGGGGNMVVGNYFSCASGAVWNDFCTADGADSWPGNFLSDGISVVAPT